MSEDTLLIVLVVAVVPVWGWVLYMVYGREEARAWYDFTGPRSLSNFDNHQWFRWCVYWGVAAFMVLFLLIAPAA